MAQDFVMRTGERNKGQDTIVRFAECVMQAEREEAQKRAEIPEGRYRCASFENFHTPTVDSGAVEMIKRFAAFYAKQEHPRRFYVCIILGANGNGKTHLGISILEKCGYRGLYLESSIFCTRLIRSRAFHAKMDEEVMLKQTAGRPVLVIDEIGRARDAETEQHMLYDIINMRYQRQLPTVLISNKKREEFQDYLGRAVMDRISEAHFFAELRADSYRRALGGMKHEI